MLLLGKINVKAIDKEKLFVGEKGTYLDIVIVSTPNNPHSDFMIKQALSKEEREAGAKDIILGNLNEWKQESNTGLPGHSNPPPPPPAKEPEPESDELPF